jgi:putative transposase
MSRYRRSNTPGASYFFTVVSYRRRPILCEAPVRVALRHAILEVRARRPFSIDAWVLLPDHLHCLWTLPPGDADFSTRWSLIKRRVSILCGRHYRRAEWLTASKKKHRESTLRQRRYWEHQIRNDVDFARHVDYIHYNPVKHGHSRTPQEWPYSTLHRYVETGLIPADWAAHVVPIDEEFGE